MIYLAKSGRLEDTIDYSLIYSRTRKIMEDGVPVHLIEDLSFQLLKAIFQVSNEIQEIEVEIRKPQVSLEGVLDYSAVRIKRHRSDLLD